MSAPPNALYYGDNLDVLRRHIADASVDLVYLDPPFCSNRTYNVLFAEQDGSRAAAQVKAFEDTWRWDRAASAACEKIVEAGGAVSRAMQGLRLVLGENDVLAYLAMMAPRLVELRRVLKDTGTLWLHCDPGASHYLKVLMDAVFGGGNFVNEVVWRYRTGGASKRHFARKHDVLLVYGKTAEYRLEVPKEKAYTKSKSRRPGVVNYGAGTAEFFEDEHGVYNWVNMSDVWEIPYINSQAAERLGYPTQKPEALLERIILAGSKEGDVVCDPFCGCGTAIAVAHRLKRYWVGIDITHLAVTLLKHRLRDAFGDGVEATYRTIGEPVTVEDASALAASDPYQFQWWALGLVGARPSDQKKGADRGVDGRLYFHDGDASDGTKQVIFSVKAGRATVAHLRDLRGVLAREKAQIGVLISMEEPTAPMRREAACGGFYASPWGTSHPVLQLLTVRELLEGHVVSMPPQRHVDATFRRAPRREVAGGPVQQDLPDASPRR